MSKAASSSSAASQDDVDDEPKIVRGKDEQDADKSLQRLGADEAGKMTNSGAASIAAMDDDSASSKAEMERALASVVVSADDVQLIVDQFETNKREADRALRENGGDLARTLEVLTQ
jgi:NACalpha-BTF3-like transcription factor